MKVNGISNGLNINRSVNEKNELTESRKRKKTEIRDINIEASRTDIESFLEAKKIADKIINDIKKYGTDLIDHSKISGKKIFDLLQD